ncbi:MAG: biotin synthase BioB [Opitutales bacterium]
MYTLEDLRELYELPLTTLLFRAQEVHHRYQDPAGVQLCTLKSIKTGRCSEDCKYCAQSAHHNANLQPEDLIDVGQVKRDAREAKAGGATRLCMGAAWREIRNDRQLRNVVELVRAVKAEGLECCLTAGMITYEQALALKDAGLDIYNHNLDTSREYYPEIITTRTYDDRLETIRNVQEAGMEICTGGILGLGESIDDRLKMLRDMANLDPQPDSVPINALIPIPGTPLGEREFVDSFEFVRCIAVARIVMPRAMVRLSAGRTEMNDELQTLCYMAGANSIFLGDKLLTAENPAQEDDFKLLNKLGLHSLDPDVARAIHAKADADAESESAEGYEVAGQA